LRKSAQLVQVAGAQRLQVAQHQRGDLVATGQLNLRAGLYRVHRGNELAQRHQHGIDMGRQHRAFAHVGHIAALALVKAHQHRALLVHMPHRQARAVAVAPGRAFDRPQDVLGPHLAQVPQVVLQHPLLHRHLRADVQVLHLAAATGAGMQAEMRAAGLDALGRLMVNRRHRALLPVVLLAVHVRAHHFERERAFHEHHLAIGAVGNALGLDVERLNRQPIRR